MSQTTGRASAALITAVCCLLGLGAATVAVNAIASSAPNDAKAGTSQGNQLTADELINYGG
ncbi:hypothetical protein [Arsenicicoccus dermatophilus]|uniref:hypothetical protein n=1 Tax=Arsenicicoccus dermatophilus TaxID=1076331 RepID=UPI001F4CAE82|nr:hypothetical protein [Arsenicicoccus dermatophilus]MCH8614028.1 hypothetical protein [Arsenicicoccus dermatophilus]